MKRKLLFSGGLLIIVLALFIGRYIALNKAQIVGLVANIYPNSNYNTRLITNFTQYKLILEENYLLDDGQLTLNYFKENDYIVDFLPYDPSLLVKDSKLDISPKGIVINYQVNKIISNNTKILIYFLPVKKGKINNFVFLGRHFQVKN